MIFSIISKNLAHGASTDGTLLHVIGNTSDLKCLNYL